MSRLVILRGPSSRHMSRVLPVHEASIVAGEKGDGAGVSSGLPSGLIAYML